MNVPLGRIRELCHGFARQRIVVIGDVMLDHLITGEARRISPEAPIPVVSFSAETYTPGGAANVARNLGALGARTELLGVIGADSYGQILRDAMAQHRLSTTGLIAEPGRPTTVKTRITAQRHQIVRLDRETHRSPTETTLGELTAAFATALTGSAAIIVTDYAKGVVQQSLLDAVLRAAKSAAVPVCLDPKPAHRLELRGCAVLTPNRKETFELAGIPDPGATGEPAKDPGLLEAIRVLREKFDPTILLVTLSEAGLLLVEGTNAPQHIPTFARQVYDVTGAGDTVIAAFVIARAVGATSFEAATIANHAAGIVVGKTGTAAVTCEELLAWIEGGRR